MNAPDTSARPVLPDTRPYWLRLVLPGTQSMGWFASVTLRLVLYITMLLWLVIALCQILALMGMAGEQQVVYWPAVVGLLAICSLAAWLLGASMSTALGGSPLTFPWSMVHHFVFVAAQVVVLFVYDRLAGAYAQVAMDAYDEQSSLAMVALLLMNPVNIFLFAALMAFVFYPLLIVWNIVCTLATWPIAFFFWLRPYLPQPRQGITETEKV